MGVTAVGDYSQAPYRMALQRAAANGTLTVRTSSSIYVQQLQDETAQGFRTGRPALGPGDLAAKLVGEGKTATANHWAPLAGRDGGDRETGGGSAWLRDGGLKVFLDGSLGGHTALLREPYEDRKGAADLHTGHGHGPGPTGARIWSDDEVSQHFGRAHAAGVQIHAHAIGDGAIDQGLAAYSRLAALNDLEGPGWGGNRLRHRFEHFEIVHEDQVRRCAELGIVSSSQPNFVGEWSAKGGMYEDRLGSRYRLNNRFRAFKEAGIPLAFGSDGMPFGPLAGLQSALHHPDLSQRLAPDEAAWHYTFMAAWSLHWEDEIGSLQAGHRADLVILETKELDSNPQEWGIMQTIAGGATVWTRN